MTLTDRRRHILTGSICALLLVAAISIGIMAAFGAFARGYELVGTFDAAGQGLIPGADVKVRGVNVGEVRRVRLVDGRAEVTMRMFPNEDIPTTASAEIRPKTLFGEKFVHIDPGPDEGGDDVLGPGGRIADTRGGFELEQVLSDTFPLLRAIDPATLGLVLGELADAGDGLGETANRAIVNSQLLAEVQAANLENTSQFLRDLADLSEVLASSADRFVAGGRDLNRALPVLIDGEADLVDLLQQTSRLSNDVSDLILGNVGFLEALNVEGARAIQVLHDRRNDVVPLVVGLRQYVESLTRVGRIEVGDGTVMAAVKGFIGSEACDLLPCNPGLLDLLLGGDAASAAELPGPVPAPAPPTSAPDAPTSQEQRPVPGLGQSSGADGLVDLFTGVLGR